MFEIIIERLNIIRWKAFEKISKDFSASSSQLEEDRIYTKIPFSGQSAEPTEPTELQKSKTQNSNFFFLNFTTGS